MATEDVDASARQALGKHGEELAVMEPKKISMMVLGRTLAKAHDDQWMKLSVMLRETATVALGQGGEKVPLRIMIDAIKNTGGKYPP